MVMILSVVESRDLSISTWAVEMSRMALMLQPPRPITRLIVLAGTSSRFDLHNAIHCSYHSEPCQLQGRRSHTAASICRVSNVDELKQRLVEVWDDLQQTVIDSAVGQWRLLLPWQPLQVLPLMPQLLLVERQDDTYLRDTSSHSSSFLWPFLPAPDLPGVPEDFFVEELVTDFWSLQQTHSQQMNYHSIERDLAMIIV